MEDSTDWLIWEIQHIRNFSAINLTAALFTIFVLCQPFTSVAYHLGRLWPIICTTIHVLLHVASLVFIVTCSTGYLDFRPNLEHYAEWTCRSVVSGRISVHNLHHAFNAVMFCYGAHFFLGIVIFSKLNIARVFSPILFAAVFILKNATTCCCGCQPLLRYNITKFLDGILLTDEEREAEEKREEEVQKRIKEEVRERRAKKEEVNVADADALSFSVNDHQLNYRDTEVEDKIGRNGAEKKRKEEFQNRRAKKEEVNVAREGIDVDALSFSVNYNQLNYIDREVEDKIGGNEEEKRRKEEVQNRRAKKEEVNFAMEGMDVDALDLSVTNHQMTEELSVVKEGREGEKKVNVVVVENMEVFDLKNPQLSEEERIVVEGLDAAALNTIVSNS